MITGEAATTVNVNVALPVPAELIALMVTVEAPGAVGVPEIKPVEPFTDKPAGNPEAPKLVGAFVAVIW